MAHLYGLLYPLPGRACYVVLRDTSCTVEVHRKRSEGGYPSLGVAEVLLLTSAFARTLFI